jgi:hypothetical protein
MEMQTASTNKEAMSVKIVAPTTTAVDSCLAKPSLVTMGKPSSVWEPIKKAAFPTEVEKPRRDDAADQRKQEGGQPEAHRALLGRIEHPHVDFQADDEHQEQDQRE